MGWVSVVLSTAAVIGTSGLIALYSFATADADLSLLLRGKHKPGVFKGKVVWVTGASQVWVVSRVHECFTRRGSMMAS